MQEIYEFYRLWRGSKMRNVFLKCTFTILLSFGALAFFVASPATGQQISQKESLAKPTAPQAAESATVQVRLLEKQLEDSRRFQDQILGTVYWALGTLGAVAALLVGFGWFVNFRVYERDKISLERDLRAQMSEDTTALKGIIAESSAAKFDSLEKQVGQQLVLGEERLQNNTAKQLRVLERELAEKISSNSSEIKRLRHDVLDLTLEKWILERDAAISSKVYRNALRASVKALEVANELDNQYAIARVLDQITVDIQSIIESKSRPIDSYLVSQMVGALDVVNGVHAHAAAGMKERAKSLLVGDSVS